MGDATRRGTQLALAVVARPRLWGVVIRMVPRRWWRRWPPVPIPSAKYLRFRRETMYGAARGSLDAADLVAYLEWCRRMGCRSR